MVNSKQKGKRGELEFCRYLKDKGYEARRGQQYKGTSDSPDIISNLDSLHFEVKRTEKLSVYKALEQAKQDCGDKIPVVVHRRNNKPWIAIVYADDMFEF